MRDEVLDDFSDIGGWLAVASGQAELALAREPSPRGSALRLSYDFHDGGGFVVARKPFSRSMPAVWALTMRVRGEAPANKLEIKLADPSNKNVWWWHRDSYELPAEWRTLRIRSSEVGFAWGPAGGGSLAELGALEIAIAAGPGGRGTMWIEDLRFENLELTAPPATRASSSAAGHPAASVLDPSPATSWRAASDSPAAWLELDFGAEHELGGLVIGWAEPASSRAVTVEISDDARVWSERWRAASASGARSYVYLPGGARARYLRLRFERGGPGAFAVTHVDVRPFDFSRSLEEFFHAVAASEPRGHHPRWLAREQSYWTPVNADGGPVAAILNEEGQLEPDRASFSLEPFLHADGALVTWADVEVTPSLADGCLPVPSSIWRRRDGLTLSTTAFATDPGCGPVVYARYRVANQGTAAREARLFVAIRPFQVSPPWQAFQGIGGASKIRRLSWRDGAVEVEGALAKRVVPITEPAGFGAAAFEQGGVLRSLEGGALPPGDTITDSFEHASGALAWDLALPAGASAEVLVAVPYGAAGAGAASAAAVREASARVSLEAHTAQWSAKLGRVSIALGGGPADAIATLRTATAHILVNRDRVAIQPGPRRYTRSWVRDGATMAAALLRMGLAAEVRDFIRWYAPYQRADGNVPCAVDHAGADWLPEHDSHGQLVFLIAEYHRFTGDLSLVDETWPAVVRAIDYLEALRATRLTPEHASGSRKACYGILPESASHEGYLAHPVHAYWDDFWALRGIGDATYLARVIGDHAAESRFAALHGAFHEHLYASIAETIAARELRYVPGSVEWADFDPTATSTAISTTDAADHLPADALAWTYDEYLRGVTKRRRGEIDWNNYTAYEIRTLGALVRLGRRAEALELMDFFLADRRPRAWNQWPEISWRDPRSPGHLGDVPHSWIGSEFVLALLSMLAYERPGDQALVLAAGVGESWLDGGDVAVENLPTWWGPLTYRLRRSGPHETTLVLAGGLATPPGGIVLAPPPLGGVLRRVTVNGADHPALGAARVTIDAAPATIVMRY